MITSVLNISSQFEFELAVAILKSLWPVSNTIDAYKRNINV